MKMTVRLAVTSTTSDDLAAKMAVVDALESAGHPVDFYSEGPSNSPFAVVRTSVSGLDFLCMSEAVSSIQTEVCSPSD